MKICTNCKNEFTKGKIVSGNMGSLWVIFIFISMGLGFILWLVVGRKKKEVCPYCGNEYIIDKITTETKTRESKIDSWKKDIGVIIFIIIIIIAFLPNKEEREQEKKELNLRIEKLTNELKNIPITNVNKNLEAYSELLEYDKNNTSYNAKYKKYSEMSNNEFECTVQASILNQKSLRNKSTYDTSMIDEYRGTKWINENTVIVQSSFSGKNDFGVEINFVSKYRCTINKNNSIAIKRLNLNRL